MRSIVLGLGLAVLGAASAHADVMAEIRAGKVQCFEFDAQKKTCKGLFSFVAMPDGSITSGGDILLNVVNGSQVLVMRAPMSATSVKGDTTCSPMRKSDVEDATILLDGMPVDPASARRVKDDMEARQAANYGKIVCSIFTPSGAGYLVTETMGGQPQAGTAHMIWVKPSDGYRVAP